MVIKVELLGDGDFEIEWDENDPVEAQMNDWSEQDFLNAISEGCEQIFTELPLHEVYKDQGDSKSKQSP